MDGIISDGISDNDSGYGTPIVKEADHLTRINEEFETDENLRRENKALALENKEIKEQLNLITRKYEVEKEEWKQALVQVGDHWLKEKERVTPIF